MRNGLLACASVVVMTLAASGAVAASMPDPETRTARAEANVAEANMPVPAGAPVPVGSRPATERSMDDLRESAALVLVGSMLIGLAAAVRRTV